MLSNRVIPEAASDIKNLSRVELVNKITNWQYGEEYLNYYLLAVMDLLDIKIVLRSPFWLLQENNARKYFKQAFETLVSAIARLGLDFKIIRQNNATDPIPNKKATEILLSFHTHGEDNNLWHLKDASLPHRFFFNKHGYSGWVKLSDEQKDFIENGQLSDFEKIEIESFIYGNIINKSSVITQSEALVENSIDEKSIFFPLQIIDDTVASHWNFPMKDAINAAVLAARDCGRNLIIKRHPLCTHQETADAIDAASKYEFVTITQSSIHEIIKRCGAVVIGNSSVGLAALLYGKPVFSFGASEYQICTKTAQTPEELYAHLISRKYSSDIEKNRRYFHIYKNELTFDIYDEYDVRKYLISSIKECILSI